MITQFRYNDDPLSDPMLDDCYVDHLIEVKGATEYVAMRRMNAEILVHLERAFAQFGVQLVDVKLARLFMLCLDPGRQAARYLGRDDDRRTRSH